MKYPIYHQNGGFMIPLLNMMPAASEPFVHIKGKKSHGIVEQALTTLVNLQHRGGRGSEQNTGDGAGILIQIPHQFMDKVTAKEGFSLPQPGDYGLGMLFMPTDASDRNQCEKFWPK